VGQEGDGVGREAGVRPVTIKMSKEEYELHRESYDGVCLGCGDFSCGGVEPDAEGYECESCGEPLVMGIESALVAGEVSVE